MFTLKMLRVVPLVLLLLNNAIIRAALTAYTNDTDITFKPTRTPTLAPTFNPGMITFTPTSQPSQALFPSYQFDLLFDFYNSTGGNTGVWSWGSSVFFGAHWNFSGTHNPCTENWQGITCDRLNTSVRALALPDYNLVGTLPESLGFWPNLTIISIDNSVGLMGTIPSSLGNLHDLIILQLNSNGLTGTIPESIFSLPHLLNLQLNSNFLNGTLPEAIGKMTQMTNLELNSNLFTQTIPKSFTNLIHLTLFELSDNYLTGTISSNFSKLHLVKYFQLDNNMFHGKIPLTFHNMTRLQYFFVNNNMLTGHIPSFYIESNLSAKVGMEWKLGYNELSGPIPTFFCDTLMDQLTLNNNEITGTVPECLFAGQSQLTTLVINNNYLHGTLPAQFSDLFFLTSLYVNDNAFSGHLPNMTNLRNLQTFYAQKNSFNGSLQPLVDSLSANLLTFVDISANELVGTLPVELFNSASLLQSFAVASNCITGSIPEEICQLQSLLFLDLDGLSTAQNCRKALFPGFKGSNTFFLKDQISGSVPECLFTMSAINTLQVSGNQIQWTLPSVLPVSNSLWTLSMSHNQLMGTIPASLFENQWDSLDLSFNKITGTLSENENITSSLNYTLKLQVNRLSGYVPSVLLSLDTIEILKGNLFACGILRTNLPGNDPDFLTYQCGSDSFNRAAIIWCLLAALFIGWNLVGMLSLPHENCVGDLYISKLFHLVDKFQSIAHLPQYNLTEFCTSLANFRSAIFYITICICVIASPLYITLTVYFKTLTHEYAWIISAAFLSGEIPAFILLAVFALIILCFCCMGYTHSPTNKPNNNNNMMAEIEKWDRHVQLLCISFLNCVIILVVNAVYVGVILESNTTATFFTQLIFAFFKLVWNDFAVRYLVRASRSQSYSHLSHAENSATELPTLAFIVLFNTIIAPCLGTAIIDPNCFVNAFVQPRGDSSLPVYSCSTFSFANCSSTETGGSIATSFEPPFIYSHQCSSAILTNYASVYVYMFAMVAFIKPVLLVFMEKFYREIPPDSILHIFIENTMYELLKPPTVRQINSATRTLFKKDRFALRLISKLTVFLTFGVVFPPIAVVICVAFYSETYLNEIILGKYLNSIEDETLRVLCSLKLQRDSEGALDLLYTPTMRLVIPFTAFFYACFVFDIYGDAVGTSKALWTALLLIFLPLAVYLTREMLRVLFVNKQPRHINNETDNNKPTSDVELKHITLSDRGGDRVVVGRKEDELQSVDNIMHSTTAPPQNSTDVK